jgi:hypothetical protein
VLSPTRAVEQQSLQYTAMQYGTSHYSKPHVQDHSHQRQSHMSPKGSGSGATRPWCQWHQSADLSSWHCLILFKSPVGFMAELPEMMMG